MKIFNLNQYIQKIQYPQILVYLRKKKISIRARVHMFNKKRALSRINSFLNQVQRIKELNMEVDDIIKAKQDKIKQLELKEGLQRAKVQQNTERPEIPEQKREIIQKIQSKIEVSQNTQKVEEVPEKASQKKEVPQQAEQKNEVTKKTIGQNNEQLHFWNFINRIFGNISPNLKVRKKAPKINLKFPKSYNLEQRVEQIKKANNLIQLIIERYKEQINVLDKQPQLTLKLKLYFTYKMFMQELKIIKRVDYILYKISKEFICQIIRQIYYTDIQNKYFMKQVRQIDQSGNSQELVKLQQLD